MKEIKLQIKYTGGLADESRLDLYDAGVSIHGLAKALAISTNALISQGEVRKRVGSIPNVEFFLQPSRKGSFIEMISVVFADPAVQVIGTSVLTVAFWDMLKFTWDTACGRDTQAQKAIVKRITEHSETFSQEITDALETPLEQFHKPVSHHRDTVIEILRPRVGTIITLNSDTLDNVTTKSEGTITKSIKGNITKYNIITGYGRFYDDELQKTIPFNNNKDLPFGSISNITWSLHNASSQGGKIVIEAKVFKGSSDNVKRYEILLVQKYDEN